MPPPELPRTPKAIHFSLNGLDYSFAVDAVQDRHETALWVDGGVTIADCFTALERGAIFGLVGVVFLARLQAGETVTYATVNREMRQMVNEGRLAEGFRITVDDESEGAPAPFDQSATS